MREALAIRERSLGDDRPLTESSRRNLADIEAALLEDGE
jgi:hypothetical protein